MYSLCTSLDRLLQLLIIQSIAHLCTFAASYLPRALHCDPTHYHSQLIRLSLSMSSWHQWGRSWSEIRTRGGAGLKVLEWKLHLHPPTPGIAISTRLTILRLHSFLKDLGPRGMLMQVCRMENAGYRILSIVCRTAATTSESCSISPSSSRHALMAQGEYQPTVYSAGRQKC